MELNRFCVKIFAGQPINVVDAVPVFHEWIRRKRVPQHMLIDVADYSHVWHGPGVMLISHEANFSLDQGGGKLGLLYQRKAPFTDGQEPLRSCVAAALGACGLLEDEAALNLKFNGGVLEVSANDRGLAPASDDTYSLLEKKLGAFLPKLYPGASPSLTRNQDPKERPQIRVESTESADVKTLLSRM